MEGITTNRNRPGGRYRSRTETSPIFEALLLPSTARQADTASVSDKKRMALWGRPCMRNLTSGMAPGPRREGIHQSTPLPPRTETLLVSERSGPAFHTRSHDAVITASAETKPENQSRLVRRQNSERASDPEYDHPGCQG
ncbi:hypothetical protein BDW68DRAFT_177733 [Aspergillus falconensis]